MVNNMGTRMERYKERKKTKFINLLKFNMLFLLFVLMVIFLFTVNETIIALNCMENPILLSFDFKNNLIYVMGKSYYINLSFISNLF